MKKNIALYIILSIVTCGIFGLYWLVTLADDANTAADDKEATSGGLVLLLSIVTCGIYQLYWCYTMGEKLNRAKQLRNQPADSSLGILYLLLTFFGFGIVTYALMQNELNKLADVQ